MAHPSSLPGVARLLRFIRGKRAYIQATSIYSIERLASTIAGFLVYLVMGRFFGPANLGAYNYAQTAAYIAGPFLASGAEAVMIRELVRFPDQTNGILGSGARIILTNSLLVIALPVLFVWAVIGNRDDTLLMTVFFVMPFFCNGLLVIDHYFRANMLVGQLVTARVLSLVLGLVLKLGALLAGLPPIYVAVGFAIEQISLVILLIMAYHRLGLRISNWSAKRETAWLLFRQSGPAMLSAVVVQLFFRINFLMLGALYRGPDGQLTEVGLYGLAFQIVQLTNLFPSVVFAAIYPRLVALHLENPKHYQAVLRWLLVGSTGLGYFLVASAQLFAAPVLHFVFGNKFDSSVSILIVLSVATVFNFSGSVRAQLINIEGVTHYHLLNAAMGLTILVPASFYLIPLYGGLGAAWAALAATFASGVLTSFVLQRTRSLGVDQLYAFFLLRRSSAA